jgi:SpoVK/Ycf46/Vps4 family AAA+-type ATPase
MPLHKNVDLKSFVSKTEGFTGADIEAVVREAGMQSIKRNYTAKDQETFEVTNDDFEYGYSEILKTTGKEQVLDSTSLPEEVKDEKPEKKDVSKKKNTSKKR